MSSEASSNHLKLKFWLKVLLCYLAIYIGVAVGFAVFSTKKYEYREFKIPEYTFTVLSQPVMELIAGGKVTHWYDWQTIDASSIPSSLKPTTIRPSQESDAVLEDSLNVKNVIRYFQFQEYALVSPEESNQPWSPIFCIENTSICKRCEVMVTGPVRLLADKTVNLYGITKTGSYTEVHIDQYVSRNSQSNTVIL
jgi:hypothetical protein